MKGENATETEREGEVALLEIGTGRERKGAAARQIGGGTIETV